ncbi:MAG: hypothetical protein IJD99_02375 [Clostridia bacterium]|nr:hypothetical protein [Clostridia bacterium]
MKRLIALVLALLLCGSAALAEFDTASLRDMENTTTFTHPGTVNTVTRLLNQPYLAQVDAPGEGELSVFVDFITLPDYEVTLLRLLTGTVTYAPLAANEMRITAGGKRYTFTVNYEQSEYDGIYMEDYAVCLTDTSLPLLKAIAQQKTDKPIQVEYLSLGEVVFSAQVIIPGQDAALIYDRFVDYGGKKQDLSWYDAMWPCKVEKVK